MKRITTIFLICFLAMLAIRIEARIAQPRINCRDEVLLGDPVSITVDGLPPNGRVTLSAEMIDRAGRLWRSSADFPVPSDGKLDLSKHAPVAGTYSGIDSIGLLWSMQDTKEKIGDASLHDTAEASAVTFRATVEGRIVAEKRQKRWKVRPGVSSIEVREKGLIATFFKPQGNDPKAAVLVVGGSGGGIGWQREIGGLLASHGYAALALAYFGMEGLPDNLEKIPLEYFQTAIEWIASQAAVDKQRIAIVGVSKGGELALLLGSRFPQIRAVAAYVPGSVVFQSIGAANQQMTSSWTFNKAEEPFVPYAVSEKYRQSKKLVDLYESSLENKEAVEKAVIPVEKIRGAVLLLSGRADSLWPSTLMSDQVIERLKRYRHPHSYRHIAFVDAGHAISRPGYMPTADSTRLGGTPRGNAHAQAEGWKELLGFLSGSLKR